MPNMFSTSFILASLLLTIAGHVSADEAAATPQMVDIVIVGCGNSALSLAYKLTQPSVTPALDVAVVCDGHEVAPEGEWSFTWWWADGSSPKLTDGIPINADQTSVERNPLINNRGQYWPRCTTLGGCSVTNGQTFGRNGRSYWAAWAAAVNATSSQDFDFDTVNAEFRGLENFQTANPNGVHGTGGPMAFRATPVEPMGELLLAAYVNATGTRFLRDVNGGENVGFGYTVRNTDSYTVNGVEYPVRQDAWSALIKPVLNSRPNLRIINGLVVKLLLKTNNNNGNGNGASRIAFDGVKYLVPGGGDLLILRARSEVVVAAGAIESVKLLQLSGIGDCNQLASVNVACLYNNVAVGKGIMNQASYVTVVAHPAAATEVRSKGSAVMGLYLSSLAASRGETIPDMMIAFGRVAAGATVVVTQQNRNTARGTLKLLSNQYHVKPEVSFNVYGVGNRDIEALMEAFRINRAVAQSFGGAVIELSTGAIGNTDSAIKSYILANVKTNWHIHGGAAMGSVVDTHFRVVGVAGLRVCDNSVAPVQHPAHASASSALEVGVMCAKSILSDRS